jgi:hypothetical protein
VKTIYKYPFGIDDRFAMQMPVGAEILHAEMQGGTPCLWALVDSEAPRELAFRLFGTGHPFPEDVALAHVSTFQQGPFVWHLFRVEEA